MRTRPLLLALLLHLVPTAPALSQPTLEEIGSLCEVAAPACQGPVCHTLPAPLGAFARPSFVDPDGSVWVHDAVGATWRVTSSEAAFVSDDTIEVRIADGDIRWAARVAGSRPAAIVRRVGDGPFVEVESPLAEGVEIAFVAALFGSGDADVWAHVERTGAGIPRHPQLFHYDGATWSEPDGDWPDIPSAFAADPTHAWAIQGTGGPGVWTLMEWDGSTWAPVVLDGTVTAVAGRAGDDVWAISGSDESRLWRFDGSAWSVVGPASGPLALTEDGAAWAQHPFGTLARFVDGVASPVVSSFTAPRLLADHDGVWPAGDASPDGLVRVDAAGACGGDVDDEVTGVRSGQRVFATWVTFEADGPRSTLAVRENEAPWRRWRLAPDVEASLLADGEAAWALIDPLPGSTADGAVMLFDGDEWLEVLALPDSHVRGGAAMADGTVWLLTTDALEQTSTTVWIGDENGFVEVHHFEDFAATRIDGADGDVWIAGGTQLWRWRDGVWARQSDAVGNVTALQVRSRDEVWLVDDGHLVQVTDTDRRILCPDPLRVWGIVDLFLVEDGLWVITQTRLYHWDGSTLREGPVVEDDKDGPRAILEGRIAGAAAWLTTTDGLLEVTLEKGGVASCTGSDPAPAEGEGEPAPPAAGCDCRSTDHRLMFIVLGCLVWWRRRPR